MNARKADAQKVHANVFIPHKTTSYHAVFIETFFSRPDYKKGRL